MTYPLSPLSPGEVAGCEPTYAYLPGLEVGRYSGSTKIVDSAAARQVYQLRMPPPICPGLEGMASVQIMVADTGVAEAGRLANANGKLVADISWQTALGGGTETIDIQHGAVFTVAAATALNISARFESAVAGAALSVYQPKRVETSVHWGTSINPKSARYTAPGVTLVGATPSVWFPIPKTAESMLVFSNTPASLGTLLAEFATTPDAATVRYATLDPNANGTILDGVDFVRFTGNAQFIMPSFQLWL